MKIGEEAVPLMAVDISWGRQTLLGNVDEGEREAGPQGGQYFLGKGNSSWKYGRRRERSWTPGGQYLLGRGISSWKRGRRRERSWAPGGAIFTGEGKLLLETWTKERAKVGPGRRYFLGKTNNERTER
ncbi:uncharacterized protein LOC144707572 isoform X2 [Wolffia australiana]